MRLARVNADFIEKKLDKLYAERDKLDNKGSGIVVRVGRMAR